MPLDGPVVQWYECRPRMAEAVGSNPARSTNILTSKVVLSKNRSFLPFSPFLAPTIAAFHP